MEQGRTELGVILARTRRRWVRRQRLNGLALGAVAATMVIVLGALADRLLAADGLALALLTLVTAAAALVALGCGLWPAPPPSETRLARYIEERLGGLDDLVVTAAAHHAAPTALADSLAASAAHRITAADPERIIGSAELRRAGLAAAAASVVLAGVATMAAPVLWRSASILAAYVVPERLLIEVEPGHAKVRVGDSLTIRARLRGFEHGVSPELHLEAGESAAGPLGMVRQQDGTFAATVDRVERPFPYSVRAGRARSESFRVDVIRPARVARIDLRYRFPGTPGPSPRIEEGGGDIYGPSGTMVDLTVTTDKAVASGAMTLDDGTRVELAGDDRVLQATMAIRRDGSYRIALRDVDGLENPGDTRYFIRLLDDRPPDVRILRPGGDRQVTPLEEVVIEAAAEDDFALAGLAVVIQVPGQRDVVLPVPSGGGLTARGAHLVQLEALGVKPGHFVTYYARARDVGHGRRPAESRSDLYFLEVKPFEETFVAAQSQAMGMEGGSPDLQALVEAQKQIITATWKLDARGRRAGDARSAADIRAVSEAQNDLRVRAARLAGDVTAARAAPGRPPRPGQTAAPGAADPMARAVEFMGRAVGALDRLQTAEALPHEMSALEQLLEADADVQQRQIARQQSGGGGSSRQGPDLSTLFDQQLRQLQQTNYELPGQAETRPDRPPAEEALARVRELARRQEALRRAQQALADERDRLSPDERARQLERLTREQQRLTREASDLLQQVSEDGGSSTGGDRSGAAPRAGAEASERRRLRHIADEMRGAAADLERDQPSRASARAGRALDQLRELTRQMEQAQPDAVRRALGDLQFEARQLADAERRLAGELERVPGGAGGAETRRRVAAEQDRLADRTDRLREAARQISGAPAGAAAGNESAAARQAAREAAAEMDRLRLSERQRAGAGSIRSGDTGSSADARDRARALDRIAGRLGEAAGTADRDTERLSENLRRAGELRDRLTALEQTLGALHRGTPPAGDSDGARPDRSQPGPPDEPGPGAAEAAAGRGAGPSPGGNADDAGRLSALQREAVRRLREAEALAGELRRQHPGLIGGSPEDWYPSVSAPGTEAFKQDYSRWTSLKAHLLVAIEQAESQLSRQLREREAQARLHGGGHETVAGDYQVMIDRYYESLAAPRRHPR